jgi:hypothetical protein
VADFAALEGVLGDSDIAGCYGLYASPSEQLTMRLDLIVVFVADCCRAASFVG